MASEAPPSCMRSHVEWLERLIRITTKECRAGTGSTKMLEAIHKEYKFHCQHLRAEEMALTAWCCDINKNPERRFSLREEAVSAHSEVKPKCSSICSFWYCMRKGRRRKSYKVNFFSEGTDDCLWPSVVYEPKIKKKHSVSFNKRPATDTAVRGSAPVREPPAKRIRTLASGPGAMQSGVLASAYAA